jgi:hypothetical protein
LRGGVECWFGVNYEVPGRVGLQVWADGQSTLFTVPTPGSFPPVTEHGLCACFIVHSIAAAGHIWTVERSKWDRAGQVVLAPVPREAPAPAGIPYPLRAPPSRGQTLSSQMGLGQHAPRSNRVLHPQNLSYWKDGGRESPMPPVRSRGGGRSVWLSVPWDPASE